MHVSFEKAEIAHNRQKIDFFEILLAYSLFEHLIAFNCILYVACLLIRFYVSLCTCVVNELILKQKQRCEEKRLKRDHPVSDPVTLPDQISCS